MFITPVRFSGGNNGTLALPPATANSVKAVQAAPYTKVAGEVVDLLQSMVDFSGLSDNGRDTMAFGLAQVLLQPNHEESQVGTLFQLHRSGNSAHKKEGELKRVAARALTIVLERQRNADGRFDTLIKTLCADKNAGVRKDAALTAKFLTNVSDRNSVIQALCQDRDPDVHLGAAMVVHFLANPSERKHFITLLAQEGGHVRAHANSNVPYESPTQING